MRSGGETKRWNAFVFCVRALVFSFPLATTTTTGNFATCKKSLGMQTGALPDQAISASSAYDEPSVGAINGRIRTERNGGAWCPKEPITKNAYEWIELDLQEIKVITQVETQGRFGNGQGQEFAETYMLEYRRQPTDVWIRYHDRRGNELFTGNSNTYIAEMRDIVPPIIARWLRVIPYSNHPRIVCMRVELYGCVWRDGLVSYNMPQGERRGLDIDLFDFTYDYNSTDGYLSGGLGQLTDGIEGHTNFRLDPEALGLKGYEWVGWKNDSDPARRPVEILFVFDRIRNFSAVRIHANNMFSKDVRVFRRAVLYFSVTGKRFQEAPIVHDHPADTMVEFARNVVVSVGHRLGKFVRLELHFDARWLLVSEVRFESEIVRFDITKEPEVVAESSFPVPTSETNKSENSSSVVIVSELVRLSSPAVDQRIIVIASITVTASLLLALFLSLFFIVCSRRQRKTGSSPSSPSSSKSGLDPTTPGDFVKANPCATPGPSPLPPAARDPVRPLGSGRTLLVTTSGSGSNVSSTTHVNGGFRDAEMMMTSGVRLSVSPGDLTLSRRAKVTCQTAMNKRQLPEIPKATLVTCPDYQSDTNTSTYAVPGPSVFYGELPHLFQPIDQVASPSCLSPSSSCASYSEATPSSPPFPPTRGLCCPEGAAAAVELQGSCGSSLYSAPLEAMMDTELWNVAELDRRRLRFVGKIGEGIFGEVHLCELEIPRDSEFVDLSSPLRSNSRPAVIMVAIKVLNKCQNIRSKSDFLREASLMSKLTDPNIVSLVGACTRDEPFAIAIEYMKYGDLNQFLKRHHPAEPEIKLLTSGLSPVHTSDALLSYGSLIYMAMQIGSGMKYLEGLGIVHRDLATRNCLVGNHYLVKVSDFGMSRDLFAKDYYRFEGRAMLPIRWMAWESVMLGKFTTMSDVWSFGVTLWEILTFARRQPFETLTDDQVIENCAHYYNSDCDQICLPPPHGCPKEIIDLMRECWNRDETRRPTFHDIHMFLERKNHGYRPMGEAEIIVYDSTLT